MSFCRQVRRVAIHLRTFLNALTKCFPFPLQFVRRLFHSLLRLHSSVASTQQCISTVAPPDHWQVASSRQPSTLPLWNGPVSPQPGGYIASNVSSPIPPLSTNPPSSAQVQQSSSAVPAVPTNLRPFMPSKVTRYNKFPTM